MTDYALLHLEPTTTDIYKILLDKHIDPSIGHLKLSKIQPSHLNKLYMEMARQHRDGTGCGYSPTTIKRVHALISSILSTAVQWNILTDSPCKRVRPPKQTKDTGDINFFTPEQTDAFLGELDTGCKEGRIKLQHVIFFQLAIFCGVRRSEAVALTWNDIDYDNRTLNIDKATVLVKGRPYTKAPKNKTSIRVISLPECLIQSLEQYQAEYDAYRLAIRDQWKGADWLFIQWNGLQMYPSTMNSVMRKVIKRYNDSHEEPLPAITPHGLRHTSATLLISENVDIRTVSNRLGHAQTSTTMNIYSHSLQKKDEAAADSLAALLYKKMKKC